MLVSYFQFYNEDEAKKYTQKWVDNYDNWKLNITVYVVMNELWVELLYVSIF